MPRPEREGMDHPEGRTTAYSKSDELEVRRAARFVRPIREADQKSAAQAVRHNLRLAGASDRASRAEEGNSTGAEDAAAQRGTEPLIHLVLLAFLRAAACRSRSSACCFASWRRAFCRCLLSSLCMFFFIFGATPLNALARNPCWSWCLILSSTCLSIVFALEIVHRS